MTRGRITLTIVAALTVGTTSCGGSDATPSEAGEQELSEQETSAAVEGSADAVSNLPPPELPFEFGRSDQFAVDIDQLSIPVEIKGGMVVSDVKASAMVMTVGEPERIEFLPVWSVSPSGAGSLRVPIERIVPGAPGGSRVTLAVELRNSSGATA